MKWIVILILVFSLFIFIMSNNKEDIFVDYVIDGDTFISEDRKIRIWGIDAPEKKEKGFDASTDYMNKLILNKILSCVEIDIDKYKRSVMRCYLGKEDIARLFVSKGFSRDYEYYSEGYYK